MTRTLPEFTSRVQNPRLARGPAADATLASMPERQKVMVLYLASSALDSRVVAWAVYDGTGKRRHMAGDSESPPYESGLAALEGGWRLLQMSPLIPHAAGQEFETSYLKYEFLFEQLEQVDG